MATEEDEKDIAEGDGEGDEASASESAASAAPVAKAGSLALGSSRTSDVESAADAEVGEGRDEASADDASDEALAPTQLGTKRFVYAAYFAGAIGVAFLVSKIISVSWQRLALYKPTVGEPHDEIVMPLAAALGGLTALYYWKRTSARRLAEEVAEELAQVTWPNKEEVTNSTAVVIVTTALATIFFALMDRFWGFVTNLVYGT